MLSIDWKTVERLRAVFLDGTASSSDYWQSETDLLTYDLTFARRIGWKWDYVLGELKRLGWTPPSGALLDWGCGTGIAHRKYCAHFEGVTRLFLCDRSPLAMRYAAQQARGMEVWQESLPPRCVDVLLISHVMTEQPDPFTLPCDAKAVIIVEPGTFEVSRRLIALRERLRHEFHVVAPCTHQAGCGLLAPGNERHWCHHFAPSPTEAFTETDWARFAKVAGVDLRSLPLSYLVLDRRPVTQTGIRIIGRPRVYKAHAQVLGCDANGVREHRVEKRTRPELYRQLKKGVADSLWTETKTP